MIQPLIAPDVQVDLTNCDLEPIHIPSLIQAHGMLLAARESDERIVYVSANSQDFVGVSPARILEQTLTELLGAEAVAAVEHSVGRESYVPRDIRSSRFPVSGDLWFDVTAHRANGLICVELEVALERRRWDLMGSHLETAMRELGGRALHELYEAVPALLRTLTGYDRIMVYKFDADGHGEVVGEAKAPEMDPFLGLHYPASDIPRQARQLFLEQRFRTIVDVNYTPVPVVGNRELVGDQPLDMTFCSLRSSSPMHVEYLRNMGVGASFAISLILSGELWGLIVGHHRTSKRMAPESRALCDLLGQLTSLLLGVAQQANAAVDYQVKKSLLDLLSVRLDKDLRSESGLGGSALTLLDVVHADGAVVRLDGSLTLLGKTPEMAESRALLEAFEDRRKEQTFSTDCVGTTFPDFAHLAEGVSGGLYVPFQEPLEGILWLRGQMSQAVRWAGNPETAKQEVEGSIRLSPRKSFALWEQVQYGRSLPWLPAEIEASLSVQRIVVRTLLQRSEANLVRFMHTDQLTGLGNRLELLERKVRWRANNPQTPACLLFIAMDGFRAINDRYEHAVGSAFLKEVGARLGTLTGGKHFLARLGGEEFALFCEDTSVEQAQYLANTLLEGLKEPFDVMGTTLHSTASVGIAPVARIVDPSALEPFRVADSALYASRHRGGNQVSVVENREEAEVLRAVIAEEIIARRLAAHEFETTHARFTSVLESTSDNVVTISEDWTMLYANKRASESIPDFEIGANYWGKFPSILGTPVEEALRTAMSERREQRYEIFFEPYRRWYRAKAFPVAEGITIFFSDVTREKNIEEQLKVEQLLREKRIAALTHMAAGLAHEISNPLAIIQGLASDLVVLTHAESSLPPAEVRHACEGIVKTATRASDILRGLRGFARETEHDPMELGSIYDIIGQCVELQNAKLERHDVEFSVVMDPGIPRLFCRDVQIGQILTNLVNNAFDSITQSNSIKRWIELSAKFVGGEICVDVTDSGPGIEDHFKAHLMEPFFTTKRTGLGMGVGLSLSRAIAQDHGGTLTLLPDAEHTTFRLTLPIANQAAGIQSPALLTGPNA